MGNTDTGGCAAIAWHLRVGGPWQALPSHLPPWRTVYGWFRRWLDLGLFDRLMREVAVLRRRAAGRRATPTLAIIDTQTVKCIAVHGTRGYDPAKVTVRRKRVVLVDADGVWLAHWGGLLRDRVGRLDVSTVRLAFVASLSGVQALLNPMPVRAA